MVKFFSTTILFIFCSVAAYSQNKTPEDFGFKHLQIIYNGDPVDILIKSKVGEENVAKPIFLFCEGSLPQPIIKTEDDIIYPVFPFLTDQWEKDFHLVLISKPFIPLIADRKELGNNFIFLGSDGLSPKEYLDRNYLDYYVERNKAVLEFLQSQPWVSSAKLVVAGHSQGSTVAAKLAMEHKRVSHLIYSGGSPMGRIMRFVEQQRHMETDSLPLAEKTFQYWEGVVRDRQNLEARNGGDSPKTTYDFSYPSIHYLMGLEIPVLVSYGTKDESSIFNDYLRVECIRQQKKNITFKAYIGTEHNYFPVDSKGNKNYEIYNWDKVAMDWYQWMEKQK